MFRFEKRKQNQTRSLLMGGYDAAKQSKRPTRGRRNQFPPPKTVPDYMTRRLRTLPPNPSLASSSLHILGEESYQPTSSCFHRGQESLETHRNQGRSSSGTVELEGSIDQYGMAMARTPKISIVTDFEQDNRSFSSDQQEVIHSPQPRYPIHQILKDMEIQDGSEASPAISAPALTLSSQTFEVSPLTPEDTSVCGFGRAASEPDHDAQYWTNGTGKTWIRESHEEDMPPTAPPSSLGFLLVPVKKAKKKPAHRIRQQQFRHSDPCSPVKTCSESTKDFSLVETKPHLKLVINSNKRPRPQSESSKATTGKPTPEMSKYVIGGRHRSWRREYGLNRFSPESSSSSGISFAVREIPSFSTRPRANRKPKPKPLQIRDGKRANDHIKTPYPRDDQKPEKGEPSGSSRDGTATTDGKPEGRVKYRRVGKLVSRVKHVGGVMISRLSFISEESRRAKRAAELRGKIQHLGAQSVQKNMI